MTETQVEPLIRFEELAVGYGSKRVLDGLTFSIEKGDYLAIVGSNGAGKTTLLRTLLGLLKPVAGRVHRPGGKVVFGYVPQMTAIDEIFPLTVLEIVVMGRYGRLGAFRRPGAEDRTRAREALQEVGISGLEGKLFREISGGQKQRALVARALVSDPDVLVLDEHTNNLDIAGEKAIMQLIDGVHARHHVAVVMVTHSLNAVANHARHIAIIRDGKFAFHNVEDVMRTDYLTELYGTPMRVLEVEGRRVVM